MRHYTQTVVFSGTSFHYIFFLTSGNLQNIQNTLLSVYFIALLMYL